jgi:hypothetical protein
MTDQAPAPAPVFVCGTGRSGTTVLARLLGWHLDVATVPFELRFHVHPSGLLAVADGSVPAPRFLALMRRRWYERVAWRYSKGRRARGLARYFDPDEYESMLGEFADEANEDPEGAARRLMTTVLGRVATDGAGSRVVEHSPKNGEVAGSLLQLLPDARFVAIHRDGRDAAASIASKRHVGPDEPVEALWYWADRHRAIMRGLAHVPPDRVLHIQLLDLVDRDGMRTLDRLLGFLELPDDAYVRAYLSDAMSPDAARTARWTRLPTPIRDAFEAGYEAITEWCAADGIPMPRPSSPP